jgi:hypothetical protein
LNKTQRDVGALGNRLLSDPKASSNFDKILSETLIEGDAGRSGHGRSLAHLQDILYDLRAWFLSSALNMARLPGGGEGFTRMSMQLAGS